MSEFLNVIRDAGLNPPEYIEPGRFHRFPGAGKGTGNRAGWCLLFDDHQGGVFGDWSFGLNETWQLKREDPFTPIETKQHHRQIAKAKELAEVERQKVQLAAAEKARVVWESATPVTSHPYLDMKGVQSWGIREHSGNLVLPIRDGDSLYSIQTIYPDGRKRFLPGGRVQGCYFSIGKPRKIIYLCEGYADAASIYQATKDAVAVAFNASNLKAVAESIRSKFPDVEIFIAGDNDSSGIGQKKAQEAAEAVNGKVAIPPNHGDWNDYSSQHGSDGLRQEIKDKVSEIDGSEILFQLEAFLSRFVAYPDTNCLTAHALWIVHTHLIDSFECTPRLAFLSPEPASGKTRALEITELLVPNPVLAVNVSPPYLFRKIGDEECKPTILYDEIDTIFGPKAKGNEEIRGLLNAGHRKGAVAGRCYTAGNVIKTEEIPAYCAVALAGLGGLPDTILTRSIIIKMRRRSPGEKVEPFRRRIHQPAGSKLREQIARWCVLISNGVSEAYPILPKGVEDRDADLWEPLIAIADAAGGVWPDKSRVTAVTLVTQTKERPPSLGIQLLSDLREIFADSSRLSTSLILEKLNGKEESPWGNLRGQELDGRALSSLLRQYDIKSITVRVDAGVAKGYRACDFHGTWLRYLLPLVPKESVTSVAKVTEESMNGSGVTPVTDVTNIHENWGSNVTGVTDVTDSRPESTN